MKTVRSYSELIKRESFIERFKYLKLDGKVGEDTFGFDRWMNQKFYVSQEYRRVRDEIIIRDLGCDLGVEGYEIYGKIIVHHLNQITVKDIHRKNLDVLLNPENLIVTSLKTHNAIHYGDETLLSQPPIIRTQGDTKLW